MAIAAPPFEIMLIEESGRPRAEVLGYTRDPHAAVKAVREGQAAAAFSRSPRSHAAAGPDPARPQSAAEGRARSPKRSQVDALRHIPGDPSTSQAEQDIPATAGRQRLHQSR